MDDDIDIYADLENFNETKGENYFLSISESKKLEDHTKILEEQIANLKESNKTLKMNLSSLLKTAKIEIARKDRIIAELRQQLENKTFRRNINQPFKFSETNNFNVKPTPENKVDEVYEVKKETVFQTHETAHCDSTSSTFVANKKIKRNDQNDNFVPTVFGQRLQKKLREEEESAKLENGHLKSLTLESSIKKEIKSEENLNYINLGNENKKFSISSSNNKTDQTVPRKLNQMPSSINLDKQTKLNGDFNENNKVQVKTEPEDNIENNMPNMGTDISCKNGIIEAISNKNHVPMDYKLIAISASINKNDNKTKKDTLYTSKKNINNGTLDRPSEIVSEKSTTTVTSVSNPINKIVISRRRKAAKLTDSSSSMTIVVSDNHNQPNK